MTDSIKQIIFRGTEEYRKQLQLAATGRDMKVQQLIEEALAMYLRRPNGDVKATARAAREIIEKATDFAIRNASQPELLTGLEAILRLRAGTLLSLTRTE